MDWVAPRKHEILDAKLAFSIVLRVVLSQFIECTEPQRYAQCRAAEISAANSSLESVLDRQTADVACVGRAWESLGVG
jgi:hypothetical protein